jgi:zinc/manganese transport system permease protein
MSQVFYFPETMIWPLLACLVLTGIHVYLGVHVIARKVIFVDLALAQIAALGTVTGVLLGYEVGKDINQLYLYSLAFTFFGAFIFSMTRMRGEKVPHEAIIGIVYAVAFAATILVLAKSPLGPQELDRIIKGELLWVQGHIVIKTAILYSIVGIFHYVFRNRFIEISFDPEKAERDGINVRFWDLLFYMSFGFVITSSVAIAGVFLVFSYLVIPAVGAMLLAEKISTRLTIGWVGGAIISFIGVKLSWHTGLPTSPLIVCLLALALVLAGIIRYLRVASKKQRAVLNLVGSTALVAVFLVGVFFFAKREEDPYEHTLHMLDSRLATDRTIAVNRITEFGDRKSEWLPLLLKRLSDDDAEVRKATIEKVLGLKDRSASAQLLPLLRDRSNEVRETALDAIRSLDDVSAGPDILSAASQEDDPEMKVGLLSVALEFGEVKAIPELIGLVEAGGLFGEDALAALQKHVVARFVDTKPSSLKRWWEENQGRLEYDGSTRQFKLR